MKELFPIFQNIKDLVYLDNAATTQKPTVVIDALIDFYTRHNANVHRGLYPLSEDATNMYEDARKSLAEFINADSSEIIFTGGTTDSINQIAEDLIRSKIVKENPSVLLTELEHHSNILPWQRISKNIKYIEVDSNFELKLNESYRSESFDVVSLALVSNVTGTINDIKKIREMFPKSLIIVDAAQAMAHMKVDVKDLDVDFLVFSGHKMYGPTGIGVIYAKRELLEKMEPLKVGGGMIREVSKESATWAEIPEKFEAGTPPISEAVALAEAAKFISEIGFDKLTSHEDSLRKYLVSKLQEIEGIQIYHPPININAGSVISFSVESVHPHDIAQYLGENNICIRAGHHCTQILHKEILKIPASCRVSFAIYNDTSDIDALIAKLQEVVQMFKR